MAERNREIRLASRPEAEPGPEHFDLVEVALPEPGPDSVLVRNLWMSVDPYMRGRMWDRPSYVPPFQVGETLDGGAVGEVVAGESPDLPVGSLVVHNLGWRESAVVKAAHATKVDVDLGSPQAFLGILGMPGLTAYVGLLDIGGLGEGDIVFVSAAAGAVGSVAGQIAKARGHRVIGSAGSEEKVAYVRDELGFDAAFNYRDGPAVRALADAAPEGIDLYFDNVGGEQLEAALSALRLRGRVTMCGAISAYNSATAPGPRNLGLAIGKRLTLRGFIVSDHADRRPTFLAEVGGLLAEGKIRWRETVVDGLERAPEAFVGLLRGENIGKMLVRLV
jgi:NADPH-dependent curcumin reductase CurA